MESPPPVVVGSEIECPDLDLFRYDSIDHTVRASAT